MADRVVAFLFLLPFLAVIVAAVRFYVVNWRVRPWDAEVARRLREYTEWVANVRALDEEEAHKRAS